MSNDVEKLYRALGYTGDLHQAASRSRGVGASLSSSAEPPLLDREGVKKLRAQFNRNPKVIVDRMRRLISPTLTRAEADEAIRQAEVALANPEATARQLQQSRGLFRKTKLPDAFRFPGMDVSRIPIDADDNKFETKADVLGWIIMCGPKFLTNKIGSSNPAAFRFHDKAASEFAYHSNATLPVKVALFSDFGTGRYHSKYIADQLSRQAYPYACHLGDVYYAGRQSEFRDFFRAPLEPLLKSTSLFTLPGNHEMYSDAIPFFQYIDDRKSRFPQRQKQEGSYFCLEFAGFRIVGIDTAFFEGGRHRHPKLLQWLRDRLKPKAGMRNILLSSDHPYDYGKAGTTSLLADLRDIVINENLVDLWFWGNTHYCGLYRRSAQLPFLGSCIGHGGYPYSTQAAGEVSAVELAFLETFPRFPGWTRISPDRGNNGYCEMTLQPDGNIELRYLDWMGYLRCTAVLSGTPLEITDVQIERQDNRGKDGTRVRHVARGASAEEDVAAVEPQVVLTEGQAASAVPAQATGARGQSYFDDTFYISIFDGGRSGPYADILATFRNAKVLGRVGKRGGAAGARWREIIDFHERIRAYVNGDPKVNELPPDREMLRFGALLFNALFPGDVRRLYDVARATKSGVHLDIVFTSMIDWIADKPWEFAYDPSRRTFLATEEVNFVRNVLTAVPADRLDRQLPMLRILVAVAQPLGTGHLSIEEESEVIRDGFKQLIDENLASVDILLDATPARLHRLLESASDPFDVLHFIGHGTYDRVKRLGYLLFENEEGGIQELDAVTLRQILCRRGIQIVFLNACETGSGGTAEFKGVAQELVSGGIPAVVANQYSVLDSSATAFARHFYWSLTHGKSIGDAAREARVAVNYSISGEAIDWAVPVVFARNPSDQLCAPRIVAAEGIIEQARELRRARRGMSQPERLRVAIWDAHRTIPRLREIVARLTAAQECYHFDAVYYPAPIGTWKLGAVDGETVTYLSAERIIEKLKDKPKALGLDQLICITHFPLGDAETPDLFAFQDPDYPISIFSTAGLLDQMTPPETSIERMIANLAAAFLGGLDSHHRGPKDCPYFYNEKRELHSIAGPLKFCAVCRKKLQKRFKKAGSVECLEKLLTIF